MRRNTKPAYPDWNNPQAIIVVADNDNPKKVCWQPHDWRRSDLCKCEIEFRTDCDFSNDLFNIKAPEEKALLDKECGRQLAWDRAVRVATMMWLDNVATHRKYERYAVYFRPETQNSGYREMVCICSVLDTSFIGGEQ